jgi:predicted Zn-dependent peptidase
MLLVGGAAYKFGQSSVKQIEQHTGKPAEDLTEQELEKAMNDLGIEEQEITDSDMAAIEAESVDSAPAQSQAPAPSAAAPVAAAPAQSDYIEELKQLAELKSAGIISEADFEAKKKQLLGL